MGIATVAVTMVVMGVVVPVVKAVELATMCAVASAMPAVPGATRPVWSLRTFLGLVAILAGTLLAQARPDDNQRHQDPA